MAGGSVANHVLSVLARAGFRSRKLVKQKCKRLLRRVGPSYTNLAGLGVVAYFRDYPPEAFEPEYADLWGLYLVVMKRKPAVVLELGGGYSTFVFAHAARTLAEQGNNIQFYSVDESDHWQRVVKNHMPGSLLPFVHFHRSEIVVAEIGGETVSKFESLPVDTCNFLYVDAGLLLPQANRGADALVLERNAPADYAVQIDGRKATVALLKRKLELQYDIGPGLNGVQTLFVRRARASANTSFPPKIGLLQQATL
jgi:hypothetical protein